MSPVTARMLVWKQPFIQRVRNSSLVEGTCVDNNRVSRQAPKVRDSNFKSIGRGAFHAALNAFGDGCWSAWKSKCRYK